MVYLFDCSVAHSPIAVKYCYNFLYDNIHHRCHSWLAIWSPCKLSGGCPSTAPAVYQAFLHPMRHHSELGKLPDLATKMPCMPLA
jgi:hypothetical protein